MIADATVSMLYRLLTVYPATHDNQFGAQLYLVYNVTERTFLRFKLTDERTHESRQFHGVNRAATTMLSLPKDAGL